MVMIIVVMVLMVSSISSSISHPRNVMTSEVGYNKLKHWHMLLVYIKVWLLCYGLVCDADQI